MLVIPCAHMHLPWSPRGCPCPLLEQGPPGDGLRWGICGYRASTHTLGACAGGLCHTVIQGSRQPAAPPHGDTISSALGPALAACVAVMLQGRSRRAGSALGHFCMCLLPTQIYTFFSKQSLTQRAGIFFFLTFV